MFTKRLFNLQTCKSSQLVAFMLLWKILIVLAAFFLRKKHINAFRNTHLASSFVLHRKRENKTILFLAFLHKSFWMFHEFVLCKILGHLLLFAFWSFMLWATRHLLCAFTMPNHKSSFVYFLMSLNPQYYHCSLTLIDHTRNKLPMSLW